ncbi:MAG: caspase family protein [Pirellulales bacterium]
MKILCVHGIGHQEDTISVWRPEWEQAIRSSIQKVKPTANVEFDFFQYDGKFQPSLDSLTYSDFAQAFWNLSRGFVTRPRGLLEFSDSTKWYAGMVVAWVNNPTLRAQLRRDLETAVGLFEPDVVIAHSLGSLIAYDTFARNNATLTGRTLITLGSQIGNQFVQGSVFAGRVEPIQTVKQWFHLYNPNDHVFTAPLNFGTFLTASRFEQVDATFGSFISGIATNHIAVNPERPNDAYLTHPNVQQFVWTRIAGGPSVRSLTAPAKVVKEMAKKSTPTQRALLIGINDYPDSSMNLAGCLNDVYQTSAILQERGFEAEDIRVVFNERATADAIRERLHWLFDGTADGDTRFLFYSGHGAQLPSYGPRGTIDRVQSTLVPYDFDWKSEHAITDSDLMSLYSALPYDANVLLVFDCCYSGGMGSGRDMGGARRRGLEPPDDISHRMVRWDEKKQMWVPRNLAPLNKSISKKTDGHQFSGLGGATERIGRAMPLRLTNDGAYNRDRKSLQHFGPFMPVVIEACGENESSYEYQHGATSYGAFTYALSVVLRQSRSAGKKLSYLSLVRQTAATLAGLGYPQHPDHAGPQSRLSEPVL